MVVVLSNFEREMAGFFIVKFFLLVVFSVLFCYQYLKYIPYYYGEISVFFGFCCYFLGWLVANASLTFVIPLSGHFVIIILGIVPVYLLVCHLRLNVLVSVLLLRPDATRDGLQATLQCYAVQALTMKVLDPDDEAEGEAMLIGLVTSHRVECKNPACPLHSPENLYDPCIGKQVRDGDTERLYKNPVFLKHFTKKYFEDALANYGSSVGLHVAFASFVFGAFRNGHMALAELAMARKNKPTLGQMIEIYKME
jgi:hypothetical protein